MGGLCSVPEVASLVDLLLDDAPVGFGMVDDHLRYVYVNRTLAEMNGRSVSDHIGNTIRQLVPSIADSIEPSLRYVLSSGLPITFELSGTTPKDELSVRDWLNCYYPVRDKNGTVCGVGASIIDFTERNETQRQLRLLSDNMQDLVCLHRINGEYLYVSPSSQRILGYSPDELVGTDPYRLFHPDDIERIRSNAHDVVLRGVEQNKLTYRIRAKSGEVKWFQTISHPIFDAQGNVVNIQTSSRDVTDQVQAEEAARESEERFRLSVNAMQEGLVLQNREGEITLCNDAAVRILGLTRDQIMGRSSYDPIWRAVHEDGSDFPGHSHPVLVALKTRNRQRDVVMGLTSDDNETRWISINAEPIFRAGEEEPYAAVCTFNDITSLRKYEAEKAQRRTAAELQRLSDRLLAIQESERRRIAADLHDEIGGALTGLKLLLENAKGAESTAMETQLNKATALVQETISSVREMSMDLRPSILDDMGLVPALRWYFNRYTGQTGIFVRFRSGTYVRSLRPELEVTLYRFIQEALTNVARHGEINQVFVSIRMNKSNVAVTVRDHGRGFDPDAAMRRHDASGLTGMRERLRVVDGALEIESSPGSGTKLVATVPARTVNGRCSD